MKVNRKKILIASLGIAAGAGLGFLYYKYVGCVSGACPIVRNPYSSTLYGGVLGALVSTSIRLKSGAKNADL
jgi:hypothetical protein